MKIRVLVLTLALAALAACTRSDIYCDETYQCVRADKPFCDLHGVYPESEGIGRTCISACTPGEPLRCDGTTLLACSLDGTAEVALACDSGCDPTQLACTDCAASTCSVDSVLTVCDEYGRVASTETCTFGCETSGDACVAGCTPGEALRCDGDILVVCNLDGTAEENYECSSSCNVDDVVCNDCAPGPGQAACAGGVMTTCDEYGRVSSTEDCTLGCATTADRCLDVDPSNNLASLLDMAASGPDLVLDESVLGTITINTLTGNISYTNTGATFTQPPSMLIVGGPVDIRVYYVRSLMIRGTVTAESSSDDPFPAIAFVSDGDVVIDGVLDVSATSWIPGPGALPDPDDPCHGEAAGSSAGGGGGSFHDQLLGAQGGGSEAAPDLGGMSGQPVPNLTLVPLRGGCAGGAPSPEQRGAGGGAVQLVSRTQIVIGGVTGLSSIAANGGGAPAGLNGGFGGGSGGGILLEAPAVTVNSTGRLIAVGGSGSCEGVASPDEGNLSGESPDSFAMCSPPHGSGGVGGRSNDFAVMGEQAGSGGTGGGGGGGHGWIRINAIDNSNIGPVYPNASQGTLNTR